MSDRVYFIGGILDGEEAYLEPEVTEYICPEIIFNWTVIDPHTGPLHKSQKRHVYVRNIDQPDVFVLARTDDE